MQEIKTAGGGLKMKLRELLEKSISYSASDLHICVGIPPVIRRNGELVYFEESILTSEDCEELVGELIREEMRDILEEKGQVDLSYALPGIARFRINIYRQMSTLAIAIRVIPTKIPDIDELGIPSIACKLAEKQRGLILITGPTGSGKSTTLASMINYINNNKRCHIITIEDPVEFIHTHNRSIINQREIGEDTSNYADALRATLREDPDVILIGEMRDQETIATALTAAETGHLVLSTLHTVGSAKTIDRIIDVFPPHQQTQVRSQLSTVLQGIISQQLIKKKNTVGRALATEVMVMTSAISNLIRENRIVQINTSIHTGFQYGMHSMDGNIAKLYKEGVIDYESAYKYSCDPDNFEKLAMMKTG